MSLVESRLCRVYQTRDGIGGVVGREAVDDKEGTSLASFTCLTSLTRITSLICQPIVNPYKVSVGEDPCVAFQLIRLELHLHGAAFLQDDGGHHHKASALGVFLNLSDDILGGMLHHLLAADR